MMVFQATNQINYNNNNDLIIWLMMKDMTPLYLSMRILILLISTITREERALIQYLKKVKIRGLMMLLMSSIIKNRSFALKDTQYQVVYD